MSRISPPSHRHPLRSRSAIPTRECRHCGLVRDASARRSAQRRSSTPCYVPLGIETRDVASSVGNPDRAPARVPGGRGGGAWRRRGRSPRGNSVPLGIGSRDVASSVGNLDRAPARVPGGDGGGAWRRRGRSPRGNSVPLGIGSRDVASSVGNPDRAPARAPGGRWGRRLAPPGAQPPRQRGSLGDRKSRRCVKCWEPRPRARQGAGRTMGEAPGAAGGAAPEATRFPWGSEVATLRQVLGTPTARPPGRRAEMGEAPGAAGGAAPEATRKAVHDRSCCPRRCSEPRRHPSDGAGLRVRGGRFGRDARRALPVRRAHRCRAAVRRRRLRGSGG